MECATGQKNRRRKRESKKKNESQFAESHQAKDVVITSPDNRLCGKYQRNYRHLPKAILFSFSRAFVGELCHVGETIRPGKLRKRRGWERRKISSYVMIGKHVPSGRGDKYVTIVDLGRKILWSCYWLFNNWEQIIGGGARKRRCSLIGNFICEGKRGDVKHLKWLWVFNKL